MKAILKNIIRVASLIYLFTSCGEQVPDANGNVIENGPIGSVPPKYFLCNPANLSENLSINANYFEHQSTTPDNLKLTIFPELIGQDPLGGHWFTEDDYFILKENIKNAVKDINASETIILDIYTGLKSIKLTADITLFGREAGSDLSDKFNVAHFGETEILLSYPDGNIIKGYDDDKCMTVSEWAHLGGMIPMQFGLTYDKIPSEEYSKVKFFLEIETTDSKVLKGECTVEFNNE